MKEHRLESAEPARSINDLIAEDSMPRFTSVTRAFLSSATSKELKCPWCGKLLNFPGGVEWVGPDSFTCGFCEQLINIRLIKRALRDLGIG